MRFYLRTGSFSNPLRFATHEVSGLKIPVPGRDDGGVRIDSLGFRSPELEVPKPEGRQRIAFVGGSTTYCAEAKNNEDTWPHRVAETLREERPELDLDYINAGVSGYSTTSTRDNLSHRVLPLEPDIVVIYHATNDISKDTREAAKLQGLYRGHGDAGTWLAQHSMAWSLLEKNLILQSRIQQADSPEDRGVVNTAGLADEFAARLRGLIQLTRESGAEPVLVTFSYRAREGMSEDELLDACFSSLYYMPHMSPAGLLEIFTEYNEAIRRVSQETGCLLIEGADEIPGDGEHYRDSVHFHGPGLRKMATRVSSGLLESDLLAR